MSRCIVLLDVLLLVLSIATMLPMIMLLLETDNDDDDCCAVHFLSLVRVFIVDVVDLFHCLIVW